MPSMTLIRGVSGSGKSTLAAKMAGAMGACHFEADNFWIQSGSYQFDASRLKEAHAWCQDQVRTALSLGDNVIVSNTFTAEWELEPYLQMAGDYGCEITVIVVENRHGNRDIHGVPDEVRARQAEKLRDSLKLI